MHFFFFACVGRIVTDHQILKLMAVSLICIMLAKNALLWFSLTWVFLIIIIKSEIFFLSWLRETFYLNRSVASCFRIKISRYENVEMFFFWLYRASRSRQREPPHFSSSVMQTLAFCSARMLLPEDSISLRWTGLSSTTHQTTLRYNAKGKQFTFCFGNFEYAQEDNLPLWIHFVRNTSTV